MNYLNCIKPGTNNIIYKTMLFWAVNSEQHISVLLEAYKETGAKLPEKFEEKLKNLQDEFNSIISSAKANQVSNLRNILAELLYFNHKFINLLERMKFECYNGYPKLYQSVLHYIYEQEYIQQIFGYVSKNAGNEISSVVINNHFNSMLYGKSVLHCIYCNVYFWSLIAAEHTNIIEGLLPSRIKGNEEIKKLLLNCRNEFNYICFMLSENFDNLSKTNLYQIIKHFNAYNTIFLNFLLEVDDNKKDDKNADYRPGLYRPVLHHIISEHEYIKELLADYIEYFSHT